MSRFTTGSLHESVLDSALGFKSHSFWANCMREKGHLEDGSDAITQLRLPRSKNRNVKEHVEKRQKGRQSKKQ